MKKTAGGSAAPSARVWHVQLGVLHPLGPLGGLWGRPGGPLGAPRGFPWGLPYYSFKGPIGPIWPN